MKSHTARLGEVASFIRGITFKPSDVVSRNTPGAVACMRTKNVQETLDQDDVWFVDRGFARRADQFLREGDILISSANSWNLVGKCCWIPRLEHEATFGGFVTALRTNKERLHARFLYHWFSSPPIQALARSFGQKTTNISNLNLSRCLAMEIPLPSLIEQRRIAAILDKADELRTKRLTSQLLLKELPRVLFHDTFGDPILNEMGWPKKTVGDFVAGFESGKSLAATDETDANSRYRVLKVSAVTSLSFRPDQSKPLPSAYEPPRGHIVRRGDLLFSRANTSDLIGATAFVRDNPTNLVLSDKLWRFQWSKASQVEPHFVRFLFQHPSVREEITRRSSGTSGSMKNISQDKVLSIEVILPPKLVQVEFSSQVEAIEKQLAAAALASKVTDSLNGAVRRRIFGEPEIA